jgi:hypothetical protein
MVSEFAEAMARRISFSHRQYFWDPIEHKPLWSLPPEVAERLHQRWTRPSTVPAQSIQILEIPFAGQGTQG